MDKQDVKEATKDLPKITNSKKRTRSTEFEPASLPRVSGTGQAQRPEMRKPAQP